MRELPRRRQKNILNDQKLESLEQALRAELVGLGLQRILTDHVERVEVAALHGVKHAAQVPSTLGRNFEVPLFFELGAQRLVLHMLETGQAVGQGAHVPPALHVVLAAQRIQP